MKQLLVNLDICLMCHSLKWMENDGIAVIFVFYLQFITQVGAKRQLRGFAKHPTSFQEKL